MSTTIKLYHDDRFEEITVPGKMFHIVEHGVSGITLVSRIDGVEYFIPWHRVHEMEVRLDG